MYKFIHNKQTKGDGSKEKNSLEWDFLRKKTWKGPDLKGSPSSGRHNKTCCFAHQSRWPTCSPIRKMDRNKG